MKIFLTASSNIGLKRETNEDAFCLCPDLRLNRWTCSNSFRSLDGLGAVSVVADGMGGHAAGEIAAAIAVDTVRHGFTVEAVQLAARTKKGVEELLAGTMSAAHEAIVGHVADNPETIGMGATIAIAWLLSDTLHIAWCGDCRCYLFRKGVGLSRLTKDHTYVQELVDSGVITSREAFNHPDGHIITRAIGDVDSSDHADIESVDIKGGDILLTCSDGLCGYCTDKTIESIIAKYYGNPESLRDALIQAALDAGGCDNITVSVLATRPDRGCELTGCIRRLFAGKNRK